MADGCFCSVHLLLLLMKQRESKQPRWQNKRCVCVSIRRMDPFPASSGCSGNGKESSKILGYAERLFCFVHMAVAVMGSITLLCYS